MSTRSMILVKAAGVDHWFYHHCDGYLSGVGKYLTDCLDLFVKNKNHDIDADEFIKKLMQSDSSFEITFYDYTDIDYLYLVDLNEKTILYWKPDMRNDFHSGKSIMMAEEPKTLYENEKVNQQLIDSD